MSAYRTLHDAGVVHVDSEPRNWLLKDGHFSLIDFEGAITKEACLAAALLSTDDDDGRDPWEIETAMEMHDVGVDLGLA